MRIYETLCSKRNVFRPRFGENRARKCGRDPLKEEDARFTEVFSLKLKDEVSPARKDSEVACISEVLKLIECLKLNEWDQSFCTKETLASQRCRENYLVRKAAYKEKKLSKEVPPYARQLSFDQLNTLLKKYPQHTK